MARRIVFVCVSVSAEEAPAADRLQPSDQIFSLPTGEHPQGERGIEPDWPDAPLKAIAVALPAGLLADLVAGGLGLRVVL